MESFLKRVSNVQIALKAPKSQYNKFGKYNYRNCEDILEAVKPLLNANNLVLTVSDDLVLIGERYYVKATAMLFDTDSDSKLETHAFARESFDKKGMDDSQITGSTSSYARKYALNGLFDIDDTKDADSQDNTNHTYKCSSCGREFKEFTDNSGKTWTAKMQYEALKAKSTDGKVLCADCRNK